MTDQTIEQIEISKEHAENLIGLADSIDKLTRNRDFKKVVLDHYFEKEAVRLVLLKGDTNHQSQEDQEYILKAMDGISAFRNFLTMTKRIGDMARKDLADFEAELDYLREEGDA